MKRRVITGAAMAAMFLFITSRDHSPGACDPVAEYVPEQAYNTSASPERKHIFQNPCDVWPDIIDSGHPTHQRRNDVYFGGPGILDKKPDMTIQGATEDKGMPSPSERKRTAPLPCRPIDNPRYEIFMPQVITTR